MKHSVQKALDITDLSYNPRSSKTSKEGYIYRRIPNHPNCTKNGYYLEHRLVVEQKIGRFLGKKEVVHHLNHITNDNRIENLVVFSSSGVHIRDAHTIKDQFGRFTKTGKIVFDIRKGKHKKCKECGKEIYSLPSRDRQFCNRKCMGKSYEKSRIGFHLGKKHTKKTIDLFKKVALSRKRDSLGLFIHKSSKKIA